MIPKLPHEPALDGLRAVAVAIVILSHIWPERFPGGWLGVNLFFVLSGYLITRLLMQELHETGTISLGQFYLRRALRLMPPLWTMLLLFLPPILLGHHRQSQLWGWLMSASYLMNFNHAFGWGPDYAFGHTWSLAAEEQFYWLWPAVLLLGARRWPRVTVACLFLTVTAWRLYLSHHGARLDRIYNGPDTNSDAILAGCFLGLVQIPPKLQKAAAALWPVWIASLCLIAAKVGATMDVAMLATLTASCFIGAAIIIGSQKSFLGRVLETKPLVFTGKISYALYLWHFPLLVFMGARWHLTGWQNLISIAFAYGMAVLSYFTVEAWARRLKKRMGASSQSQIRSNLSVQTVPLKMIP